MKWKFLNEPSAMFIYYYRNVIFFLLNLWFFCAFLFLLINSFFNNNIDILLEKQTIILRMHIYNKSVRIFYFKNRLFASRLWKYNWTLLMVRNRTFLAHGSIRLHINWKKYSLKLEAFPALLNLFTKINSNKNPTPKMANDFIMFAFTFF